MIIVAIGDPHFSSNNGDETDVMHVSILDKVKEIKPDFVVVLGDVYDRHHEVNIFALQRGSNFLFDLMDLCPTYVLVGNHDMLNNTQFFPKAHSLCAYKRYENLTIVDETIKRKIGDRTFVFVPYVPNGRFIEALDHVKGWEKADVIFGHQEIRGANNTLTDKSLDGDVWVDTNPLLITGHLHIKQLVAANIYYPGAPRQVKFKEEEERFICKLLLEDDIKIKKVKIDSVIKRDDYIKVSDIKHYKPEEGIKLKVTIIGSQKDYDKLVKYQSIIKEWRTKGIKVTTDIRLKKKVDDNVIKESIRRSYEEVVLKKIAGDDRAVKMYKEIREVM